MRKYGTKWHGPQSSVSLLLTPVCKAERESAFASLTASAELALSWRAALHHPEAAGGRLGLPLTRLSLCWQHGGSCWF